MEVEHFADSSIDSYVNSAKQFCLYTGKLPDKAEENDVYNFLAYLENDLKAWMKNKVD